jgi:hypothetical protein
MGTLYNADGSEIQIRVVSMSEMAYDHTRREAARGYAEAHLVYDSREAELNNYPRRLIKAFLEGLR